MCDTIAIVGSGRVLFAKNSDRDANEAQLLDWQPARRHEPGATVRCTWIEIPQARETRAVLLSRPFWMWGAEMGANDCGVMIGNEAVFTRQPPQRTGLTGMDLLRLALERADTAAAAVDIITALLDEFGQGGGCGHEDRGFRYHNSFLVADPAGAIVLETAGRKWATERVAGARAISNGLTIPGFAEEHSDWLKTRVSECRIRQATTTRLAEKATGVADLMALLRDHGADGDAPPYRPLAGGMGAPCMHAGGLAVGSQTTASWVAELSPGGERHWVTATAAPCASLFKPVRVGEPLDLGPAATDRADEQSLWWRHERFHRRVMRDPRRLLPLFADERDRTERGWLADPPEPERAFAEGDRLFASWTRSVEEAGGGDLRPWYVRRYWKIRNRRAGLRLD